MGGEARYAERNQVQSELLAPTKTTRYLMISKFIPRNTRFSDINNVEKTRLHKNSKLFVVAKHTNTYLSI